MRNLYVVIPKNKFQVLIGRLVTVDVLFVITGRYKFQVLIGRLVTVKFYVLPRVFPVSSPYR